MSCWTDLKTLYCLTLKPIRGRDHAERLECFYAAQAESYDDFRRRLLPGREQLFQSLPFRPGDYWVDLGAGTGSNLEYVSNQIRQLRRIDLVDLSASLLQVAARRCRANEWDHVHAVREDAVAYRPGEPVDVVTLSYSLTMIPNWRAALENARQMLRPSGHLLNRSKYGKMR